MFVSSVWPIFPAHGTQGLVKTACNIFLVKVIESEVNEDTELFSSSKLFSILKNSTKHKIFILLKNIFDFSVETGKREAADRCLCLPGRQENCLEPPGIQGDIVCGRAEAGLCLLAGRSSSGELGA